MPHNQKEQNLVEQSDLAIKTIRENLNLRTKLVTALETSQFQKDRSKA